MELGVRRRAVASAVLTVGLLALRTPAAAPVSQSTVSQSTVSQGTGPDLVSGSAYLVAPARFAGHTAD